MRLLRRNPSQVYLVVRLAVENTPAEVVAAETGASTPRSRSRRRGQRSPHWRWNMRASPLPAPWTSPAWGRPCATSAGRASGTRGRAAGARLAARPIATVLSPDKTATSGVVERRGRLAPISKVEADRAAQQHGLRRQDNLTGLPGERPNLMMLGTVSTRSPSLSATSPVLSSPLRVGITSPLSIVQMLLS